MKKISLVILSALLSFTTYASTSLGFIGGDTVGVTSTAEPSNIVVGQGFCINNGNTPITVRWIITDTTGQAGWEYTGFCDKNNCYLFMINVVNQFTLNAGEQGVMKFDLSPYCIPGKGSVKVLMWDIADSANSARLITYNVSLTKSNLCTNGIADIAAGQIALFPNPVKNQLHVSLPQSMDNARIEIYNLLGSKVLAQNLNGAAGKEIDLTGIDSGIYMARVYDNGRIIATKRFTKE
jgi:hypothetical protein